ncbi:acetylxylan esterase [Reichenbachiella sp. MALMAid0571]|uniref:alpha/beta hydrolase family protein n=1 Tax=Reichenbachiella sp. MALMAid0571 TaxID=3143939 RepID=UPI0032DF5DA4
MKKKIFIVCAFTLFTFTTIKAQEDISLFNYWEYYSDIENSLYKHFSSIAFEQLNTRKAEINQLKTKTDWLERQTIVKNKLLDIVGSFPEKTPLNAQVTGVLKKDGYKIEKVLYESKPGYYVTGAIYIPNGVKKKAPAIFYACGHSVDGFRVEIYQHVIVNLVKKGFVVFTIDPMGQGERFEYWDKTKGESKFPIPDHEHSYSGAQCLISGYSTASNFIWDAIRGIDYMLSRKETDPERIGMTGRSGGGNITAYLGALDDRILATAPECYITSYEHLYKSIGPQCAEQNLYKMISKGLDHADFIEARAPKPALIVSTTRDFFSIQGTRDSYTEAKRMYSSLGMSEQLTMVEDDTVHKSTKKNREAMYAFFQKHLKNPGSSLDIEVNVPKLEELQVTPTGQLVTSLGKQSVFSMNVAKVQSQIEQLNESRENVESHLKNIPANAAKCSGFEYPTQFGKATFSGRFVKSGYTLEKYLIPGSGNYVLPAALFQPTQITKNKIVMVLNTEGMETAVNQDNFVHTLIKEGYTVLVFDLPGIGSMGSGYLKGDSYIGDISYNQWFAALLVGKSNVGLRVEDIVRVVQFAKTNFNQYNDISALSIGPLGSELLHAAVFEPGIKKIGLIEPFLSYADIAATRFYKPDFIPFTVAGAIGKYDLPDLMATLCPRNVLIINPFSGDGSLTNETKSQLNLKFPIDVYTKKNVSEKLSVLSEIEDQLILKKVIDWLE